MARLVFRQQRSDKDGATQILDAGDSWLGGAKLTTGGIGAQKVKGVMERLNESPGEKK